MAPSPVVLLALLALVATVATAAPAPDPAPAEDATLAASPDTGIIGGIHVLYHSLSQCEQSEDMGGCLKLKAIRSLERALAADSVELVDGLSLSRAEGEGVGHGGRALDDVPAFEERALPEDASARAEVLDDLLADRARRLFQTRTLSFAVPRALRRLVHGDDAQDGQDGAEGDNAVETGRRRGGGKKGGGLLMMGLLWKGWMTMMAYKGVAVLAGKALMTATIALVLAGILALSKLAHGGHDKGHTTVEIVRHPHVTHSYSHSASHEHMDDGHGHGWGRALEEEQRRRRERGHRQEPTATGASASGVAQPVDAQQMAYRAHYQRQMQQQQQQQQQQQMQQVQYQSQQVQSPQGEAMTVPL